MLTKTLSFIFFTFALGFITACKKESLNKVPLANAGTLQVVQLPIDSVMLTGNGTDTDGSIASYLWSQVSGPGVAVIVNPGSASSVVRNLTEGLYLFQLMVIDDKGLTGVDTVFVKVNPSQIKTLSLQPANNPDEVHIWGNNGNEEGSFNGCEELGAASWTYNGNIVGQRGLVKFPLTSIPSNSTVISAKLSIYSNPTPLNGDLRNANAGNNNATLIQRVTSSWNSSTVNWVNQPATTSQNQVILPSTNISFLDMIDIDVTSLVQSMIEGQNFGFLIRLRTETIYNSRLFCSSFYRISAKHPRLVVIYK